MQSIQVVIKNKKIVATHHSRLFVDGLYDEDYILCIPVDVEMPESGDESDITMTQDQQDWSAVMAKVKKKEIADKIAKEDEAISDLKKEGKLPNDYVKPDKYKTKEKKPK